MTPSATSRPAARTRLRYKGTNIYHLAQPAPDANACIVDAARQIAADLSEAGATMHSYALVAFGTTADENNPFAAQAIWHWGCDAPVQLMPAAVAQTLSNAID